MPTGDMLMEEAERHDFQGAKHMFPDHVAKDELLVTLIRKPNWSDTVLAPIIGCIPPRKIMLRAQIISIYQIWLAFYVSNGRTIARGGWNHVTYHRVKAHTLIGWKLQSSSSTELNVLQSPKDQAC